MNRDDMASGQLLLDALFAAIFLGCSVAVYAMLLAR